MAINRDYQEDALKVLIKSPYIELDAKDAKFLYAFAQKFQAEKSGESVHQIDNDKEIKRYMTGFAAELAVERLLGVKILDTTFGHSDNYNHADLKAAGLDIGVKCSLLGNYPVVFKKPHNAEIITVLHGTRVFICGLASIQTMTKFCDEDLILNEKFKARGVKTGFYGFDQLVPFKNLDELKAAYRNLPKPPQKQKFKS
jgi:hypothetical protein